MTPADQIAGWLRALGVKLAFTDRKPTLRFPDGMDGRSILAELGDLLIDHRDQVIELMDDGERCTVCKGSVRIPRSREETFDMWGLCRATGGSLLCPSFRAACPGNSGWEANARIELGKAGGKPRPAYRRPGAPKP